MKRRGPITYLQREPDSEPQPVMSGRYLLLYKYLQYRYADTVVLTFEQIESCSVLRFRTKRVSTDSGGRTQR
jgi:hypothetical protein